MAYFPKKLFVARCRRCGKPLYKGDEFFKCNRCNLYICPTCNKKLRNKCPVCQGPLVEV